MKHDFETLVNRKDKYSKKWQDMYDNSSGMPDNIPPFSVADYDFKYPDKLVDGFKAYVDGMIFGYTEPGEGYYNSFISWVERRHDFTFKREWILDGAGVVSGISNSICAFSDVGDGIIVMPPVYPPFETSISKSKRTIVECNLINDNNKYRIDFDLLEELASVGTNKVLIMCSPHNPVGRVWTKLELSKLADICNKHNVLVVSDEIHMDVLLDGHQHTVYGKVSEAALNNSVILTSASKSFNLAGAGTSMVIIANEKLRNTYSNYVEENCHIRPNAFGFKLFELAYSECEAWFDEFLEKVSENHLILKTFLENDLSKIKLAPMEGMYLAWLDFSQLGLSDAELFDFLVNDCQIYPTPGTMFKEKGSGYIRLNLALPTWALEAALKRLKNGLKKFNF